MYPLIRNPTKTWRGRRPHHRSKTIFAPAADVVWSEWEQGKIRLDITCLCGAKQTAKHKACKLYTWFKFSVTGHCRNIAKYIGLENTTLECFSWRVPSDSDGVALSSPLSQQKNVYKHQPYAKRCILNAQRHKTRPIIIVWTQLDQTVKHHMPNGRSRGPSDRYMPWAWTWRKHQPVGEKHHSVEEKNLNHAKLELHFCNSIYGSYIEVEKIDPAVLQS